MLIFVSAEKDWEDIKFGVDNKVDFYAVSFVKDAQVVHELKNYLRSILLIRSLRIDLSFWFRYAVYNPRIFSFCRL